MSVKRENQMLAAVEIIDRCERPRELVKDSLKGVPKLRQVAVHRGVGRRALSLDCASGDQRKNWKARKAIRPPTVVPPTTWSRCDLEARPETSR